MKNLIKPMIVFGMILFLLGAMASCKEKNEEKEIKELVEKMGEAKTEEEAAEIANRIEKLEERAKKSAKEINVKLGQPFTFWQHGQGSADPQKKSEFRMTFKDPVVDKFLPYEPKFMEVFRGQRTPLRRTPADQGKKYFGIVAKIENLGPRESSFKRHMELKVDKGFIYRLVATGIVDDPEKDYPREIYTLEPGKTGWLRLWCQIPEDTYPVEVFGKLGEGYYAAPGYTKFRLELTQFGERTAGGGGDTIDSILDEEMIWAKCNNPACKAEYQTSKKGYFKYVEQHANPMAPTAPPLVCEKCGEQSVFRAEKCMNPDCGLVFFRGTIPNDFPDRCPDCKRSETEEIRKRRKSGGYSQREQETKPRTVYDVWKEDEESLEAEPSETQFKKLSPEEEIQAQRLFEAAMTERKMGRLPGIRLGYKNMVYHCREIIRRWPDSEYAFKAKRMLADIPERYHKMYNITKEEMDFSNFYQTPATNKQELIDALECLRHAMIKKINLEVDVTAQCFTSVKEYRRAKLLADVLRPVLRVLQGTLSVLSKISDATTLSGQVKTSLDNAQYVSEATSLFFMVNGLRESGEKLYYAIDDTAGYVRTVKDMLQAADQTTVVRMDPRAYKQVIKQYLDSEQGTPLIIVRTSELAPDKKPAKGALVLYKIIREEFRTLIEQIQRSELPQDFPLKDVVAEIEQLKHQIVEAGVHNIDVHYSIYHQGRKVHQSRKLGAVAEHNKAFAQVAGALAKRLDIEIYAECAKLAATGADAAYIVTYKIPGTGEAVKMTQQVSLLPQIVIEGKKIFTVDPEEQFYQMPQEMLFSLAIEFSSLLRILDDTVLSLTKLLEENSSQVPPSEVQPTPTSTKQKEPAKQIEKQVEETVKSLFKKLLRKKR